MLAAGDSGCYATGKWARVTQLLETPQLLPSDHGHRSDYLLRPTVWVSMKSGSFGAGWESRQPTDTPARCAVT